MLGIHTNTAPPSTNRNNETPYLVFNCLTCVSCFIPFVLARKKKKKTDGLGQLAKTLTPEQQSEVVAVLAEHFPGHTGQFGLSLLGQLLNKATHAVPAADSVVAKVGSLLGGSLLHVLVTLDKTVDSIAAKVLPARIKTALVGDDADLLHFVGQFLDAAVNGTPAQIEALLEAAKTSKNEAVVAFVDVLDLLSNSTSTSTTTAAATTTASTSSRLSLNSTGSTEQHATVLIQPNGKVSWTQLAETDPQLTTAREQYVLIPNQLGPAGKPPQVASVPSQDQVGFLEIFNVVKVFKLVLLKLLGLTDLGTAPAFSLAEYGAGPQPLFQDPIPPANVPFWDTDVYFVRQRTLGVNPTALRKLDQATAALFANPNAINYYKPASTAGSSIDGDAVREGNLFVADYALLIDASTSLRESNKASKTTQRYVPAPVAVFKWSAPEETLVPLAILLDQSTTTGPHQIVYNDGSNSPAWTLAKLAVKVADWNAHELGAHLTLAHLVSETVCVLTNAHLPEAHPVYQLLLSHFYKTLPLNAAARSALVPVFIASGTPGETSPVKQAINRTPLSGLDEAQCWALCASVFHKWDFAAHYAKVDIEKRGVDVLTAKAYPYGVTASATWDIVHAYVDAALQGGVLQEIGASEDGSSSDNKGDEWVQKDWYLQDWVKALQANITGVPDVTTVADLTDVLTMIIYTATHQHSAVNYFQHEYMAFLPGAPGFLTKPIPANLGNVTHDDIKTFLPAPLGGQIQAALVDMLTVPPAEDDTLAGFKVGEQKAHYVHWDHLAKLVPAFQGKIAAKLGVFNNLYKVSKNNLAKSVLI